MAIDVETPITHHQHNEKPQVDIIITADDHHKESSKNNSETGNEDSDSGKATSPQSTRSNNVSIESLDGDGSDSSIADSDSDFEDSLPIEPNVILENIRGINNVNRNTSGIVVLNQGQPVVSEISSANSAVKPQIGSIAVQNSSDITFGNKTFYQGPVTIKQFLLENDKWKLRPESGSTNGGYDQFDGDDITSDATNDSTKKGSITFGLCGKIILNVNFFPPHYRYSTRSSSAKKRQMLRSLYTFAKSNSADCQFSNRISTCDSCLMYSNGFFFNYQWW